MVILEKALSNQSHNYMNLSMEGQPVYNASNISIRDYSAQDKQRCIDIMEETWSDPPPGITKEMIRAYWRMIVEIMEGYCDWQKVACDSESVIGLLFGSTTRDMSLRKILGMIRSSILFTLRSFTRKPGDLRKIFSFFCRNILTESKVWLHSSDADGEVAFFVVSESFRGHGIGRSLMNGFLDFAKRQDVSRVYVYTTNPGCNWKFYEIVGFKVKASFDDDMASYYERSLTKGLVFSRKL